MKFGNPISDINVSPPELQLMAYNFSASSIAPDVNIPIGPLGGSIIVYSVFWQAYSPDLTEPYSGLLSLYANSLPVNKMEMLVKGQEMSTANLTFSLGTIPMKTDNPQPYYPLFMSVGGVTSTSPFTVQIALTVGFLPLA